MWCWNHSRRYCYLETRWNMGSKICNFNRKHEENFTVYNVISLSDIFINKSISTNQYIAKLIQKTVKVLQLNRWTLGATSYAEIFLFILPSLNLSPEAAYRSVLQLTTDFFLSSFQGSYRNWQSLGCIAPMSFQCLSWGFDMRIRGWVLLSQLTKIYFYLMTRMSDHKK